MAFVDRSADRAVGWIATSASASRWPTSRPSKAAFRQKSLWLSPTALISADTLPRRPADLAALGIRAGRRIVTFVGRLEPQKGVQWLIETAPAVARTACPTAILLLVGEGPLRHRLEAACRAAGIAERVHFAGWRPDVPEILAASDLLVLPSAWEGMPNVVLEAMASRLPVVASDVEGVRELLGPGAAEQIVPYGDSQALAETVVRFMDNPAIAAAIGNENRSPGRRNLRDFADG